MKNIIPPLLKSEPLYGGSGNTERYFEISGYWNDSREPFRNYIVTDKDYFNVYNDFGFTEEDIFYFGMTEEYLIAEIEFGEDPELEFTITNYKEIL